MAQAGLAWRTDLPVLRFCILMFLDRGFWRAHSVSTGHVAESKSEEGALKNLTRAIDAAIHLAREFGLSAEEWFAQQETDDSRYVRMFLDLLADTDIQHTEEMSTSGEFVLRASILKQEAA